MSRLTRDGSTKPVSQDQNLRRERDGEKSIFPIQLTTSRIDKHSRLIHTLLRVLTVHTYEAHDAGKYEYNQPINVRDRNYTLGSQIGAKP